MSLSSRETAMVEAAVMSAVASALLEKFLKPTLSTSDKYRRARMAVNDMIEDLGPSESPRSLLTSCAVECLRQDLAIALSLSEGLAPDLDFGRIRSAFNFQSIQEASMSAASEASSLLHPAAASERASRLASESIHSHFAHYGARVTLPTQILSEDEVRRIANYYSDFVIEDHLDGLRLGVGPDMTPEDDPEAESNTAPDDQAKTMAAGQEKTQSLAFERDKLMNEIALAQPGSSDEWELLQQVKTIQREINALDSSAEPADVGCEDKPVKSLLKQVHTQKALEQSLESGIVCLSDTDDVGAVRHLFITRNQPFITHLMRRPQRFESKSVTGIELQALDLVSRKMVHVRPDTFTGTASVVANLQPPEPGLEIRDGHLILDPVEGAIFTHAEKVNPPPHGATYRAVSGLTADGLLKGIFPYYDLESRLPPPAEEADYPSMSL